MTPTHELTKVLDEWHEDEKPTPLPIPMNTHFRTTNNVSRATFHVIRDNPNKTVRELCEILSKLGYGTGSTSSLVYQMIRNGYVTRDAEGRVSTHMKEYKPLKDVKKMDKPAPKEVKPVKPAKSGIASLPPKAMEVAKPAPTPAVGKLDIDAFMRTLSLPDAVELYVALQRTFNLTKGIAQ